MLILRVISTVILGINILNYGVVTLSEKKDMWFKAIGTLFLLGLIFVLTCIWII